jgi:quinol-cytochrome oxidoreductase complex cytochrome b subunit
MIFAPDNYFPVEARTGLVSLFIVKFILVSAAIIHAHITRKLLFPYIDFSKEKELTNNVMIIVWYVIIIFGWTRGG